jgi:hypothetical protein
VFVFDSSAFINGSRHHYHLDTMPSVWRLVEDAIDDGRVIVPREVYREVLDQEDAISKLLKGHEGVVADPSRQVQKRAGQLQGEFPKPGLRDKADPFVMAEAESRNNTVVTYEGITFTGAPARGADKKMPAICKRLGIRCCTLSEALRTLGLSL